MWPVTKTFNFHECYCIALSKRWTSFNPRRIPKLHFWIEHKILLRLLLCIQGLFLPPNFTLSSAYQGSEGTRFKSRMRINGEYFSQLLSMNKTHTFNTIHIFWFISHCEKDLWTKVKCRAYHQAWTHCLCDIILLLYLCTTAPWDLLVLFTITSEKNRHLQYFLSEVHMFEAGCFTIQLFMFLSFTHINDTISHCIRSKLKQTTVNLLWDKWLKREQYIERKKNKKKNPKR